MAKYKSGKSGIAKLFSGLLWLIFIVILIAAALFGYFYFGKGVNLIETMKVSSALVKPVNVGEIAPAPVVPEDHTTANANLEAAFSTSSTFTANQLAAIMNQQIANNFVLKFEHKNVDASAWQFEVLQCNISAGTPANEAMNVQICCKFNTQELTTKMGGVLLLYKGNIPQTLYLSLSANITQTPAQKLAQQYTVAPTGILLNQLSQDDSNALLKLVSFIDDNYNAQVINKVLVESFWNLAFGATNQNSVVFKISAQLETEQRLTYSVSALNNITFAATQTQVFKVHLHANNEDLGFFEANEGTNITKALLGQKLLDTTFDGETFSVVDWFTNQALTVAFVEGMLTADIHLYALTHERGEYYTDDILFYPYLAEFDEVVATNGTIQIDTEDKLLAWLDYVVFYRITYQNGQPYPKFNLGSFAGATAQSKKNAISHAIDVQNSTLKYYTTPWGFNYLDNMCILNPNTSPSIDTMATLMLPNSQTNKYPQQDNALLLHNPDPRTSTFNDFAVNTRTKQLRVSNTEQLSRALQQGYLPLCDTGSRAESIFNQAKTVLRQICNDTMTDVQKMRAIYEWLTLNVHYDHEVLAVTDANTTRRYKAWFAEGVFEEGLAVCEGYAKATAIMAGIENIPALVVMNETHAWNKVFVNGNWFEFDATHGDVSSSAKEYTTYTTFLFDKTYRQNTYQTTDYAYLQANTQYDFYGNATAPNSSFDLEVSSVQEFQQLANSIVANYTSNITSSHYSFEVELKGITINNCASILSNLHASYLDLTREDGRYIYLIILPK